MSSSPRIRYLGAETLAWPLHADVAFSRRMVKLQRRHAGTWDGGESAGTTALAKALEDWLRPRARGWSLEALRSLCEMRWFPGGSRMVSLADYVHRIASRHLCRDDDRMRLARPTPNEASGASATPEQLMGWRFLSLALPADLLASALLGPDEDIDASIDLNVPAVSEMLATASVAETHLHAGAGVGFSVMWTGLMAGACTLDPRDRKLTRGGTPPFGSGPHLVDKLLAAAVCRWCMGHFLQRRDGASFAVFAQDPEHLANIPWLPGTLDLRRRRNIVLFTLMHEMSADQRAARHRIAETRIIYRALAAANHTRPAWGSLDQRHHEPQHLQASPTDRAAVSATAALAARDPLADWFPPGRHRTPEQAMTSAALAYLRGPGREDHDFARLFWQYQRVRVRCARHLTHQPGTEGLDWFSRHYDRITALRAPIDRNKYQLALDHQRRGLPRLAAIEVRTAPERTWHENLAEMRAVRALQRDTGSSGDALEVGLVLHWIKRRVCRCGRVHADPRHLAFPMRYGAWFSHEHIKALALARLIRQRPGVLRILRGLDVASAELAVPTCYEAGYSMRGRAG